MSDTFERVFHIMGTYRTLGGLPVDEVAGMVSDVLTLPFEWLVQVKVEDIIGLDYETHHILVKDTRDGLKRPIGTFTFECTVRFIFDRSRFNRFKLSHADAYREVCAILDEYDLGSTTSAMGLMSKHLSECMGRA